MLARIALSLVMLLAFSLAAKAQDSEVAENINICNQAIKEGDASKALAYSERILKQDKNNREAWLCKGRAYGGSGQYPLALSALRNAQKLSSEPLDQMIVLTLIGNVQRSAQQNSDALASYRESLAIAQSKNDKGFQRVNLNYIGDTQADSNELQAAVDSYLAASPLAANDNERASSFARIAATYSKLGKHELAIEYQIKAELMEERGGDLDHYANANLELGRIYTVAKDYPNAEKAINKVVKLSKEQGGAYWEAKSYYYLAQLKVDSGQGDAAKLLLADAQRISEEIGDYALADQIIQARSKLAK